jgi:hypothetical protein
LFAMSKAGAGMSRMKLRVKCIGWAEAKNKTPSILKLILSKILPRKGRAVPRIGL